MTEKQVGVVVGGSLSRTLEVRLDAGQAAALGQYLMAPLDDGALLLGMVTDVALRSAESGPTSWPPGGEGPGPALLREVLLDTAVFTQLEVSPYVEVPPKGEDTRSEDGAVARARRLPRHYARVSLADQDAMNAAFAVTEAHDAFRLGTPFGMDDVTVHLDIEKLFERSSGIFGKSGTGKTVYALLFLDALVASSARAAGTSSGTVALVFDMHDDYGQHLKFEGGQRRSLKGLHPSRVSVVGLEDRPGIDSRLVIGTRDISPDDLEVLQASSFVTGQAIEVSRECEARYGKGWFDEALETDPSPAVVSKTWRDGDEPDEVSWARVASKLGYAAGSMDNLRRTLRRLARLGFVQSGSSQFSGVLDFIVKSLQGGQNVVIQFGKYGGDLTSYLLVANLLTKQIRDEYRRAVEDSNKDPNRLVIVIEEAHKFMDRALAGQTIFGEIARELRKYNVTLLVIDQRPSQIESEVLSQIGTKFCLQLDSDADIEALVGGITGGSRLRQVIASLESQRQALVFGHALSMPVVVQPPELTLDYRPGGSLRAPASLRERLEGDQTAPPLAGLFGKKSSPA